MLAALRSACLLLAVMTVVTGVVYPVAVTGLGAVLFPAAAGGSLLRAADGTLAGSSLIGQPFDDPKYFWGRPSATAPFPYNAAASSGSNLGPTNPALREAVAARVRALEAAGGRGPVPVDLVTASGSGLDPHISVAAAEYQADRIARARGIDAAAVRALVARHTEARALGFLGTPRVNVLALNLALDGR